MLGNLFKKATSGIFGAASSALDAGSTDVREAMMAAAALVAFADGDVSDSEMDQVLAQIAGSEQLANVQEEASADFSKYVAQLEKTGRMGKRTVMKEVSDLANDTDKENKIRVLLIAIEVADADNNIDDDEMRVLKEIAAALGISDELNSLI